MTTLTPFEGLPVVASAIEIPGAAGGLQSAMKIEPQEFHQGEEVYVAFRLVAAKIRHEPIEKDETTGAQRRVHVFTVTDATIIDGDTVKESIAAQRRKIDEAEGKQKLPGMDGTGDGEGAGEGEPDAA